MKMFARCKAPITYVKEVVITAFDVASLSNTIKNYRKSWFVGLMMQVKKSSKT